MTEARKLAISLIIVVVALAGVGTWLVLGMRQAGGLETAIEQKGRDLIGLREKVASVPELRQERLKLGSEVEEYETILPSERQLNELIDSLSIFREKAGLEIRQFTPVREKADAKDVSTYKRVSYELDLTGEYFNFVRFLNLLETDKRFLQVDAFSVKQKDENSLSNEITLRVSTFVYDPKAKPAVKSTRTKPAAGKKAAGAKKAPEVPFEVQKELAARFVYASDTTTRDPFSNPLTRRVSVATVATPRDTSPEKLMSPEQERASADEVEKKLAAVESLLAEDKLDDAEKLVGETAFVRQQTFRDADAAQRALKLALDWQRLDIMVRTAKGDKVYRVVEEIYEKMTAAFDAGEYDEVIALRATLDVALGKEFVVKKATDAKKPARGKAPATEAKTPAPGTPAPGTPEAGAERDPIHERLMEVVKACDALVTRAGIRKEFAAANIKIQGTFWSGKGDERKAAAIINGQTVAEGDALKGVAKTAKSPKGVVVKSDAEIVVKRIVRDKIVFAYKDELIERSQYTE